MVGGDAWHGRVVVIATGQYRQPIVPPWEGRDTYAGRLAHSVTYLNASAYAGQRVLVVGAGNSGAEIDVRNFLDDRGEPRGTSGEPTAQPGLYFVGFTHTLRGHLFEANRASRRLARNVERFLSSQG
jgi:hypothetical protein